MKTHTISAGRALGCGAGGRTAEDARHRGLLALGPEFEYYIFSKVSFDVRTSASYYEIEHEEEFFHQRVPCVQSIDLYDDFRDESCNLLKRAGIPVKYHHHEVGERGQQEIELFFEPLLKTADNIILAKYILFSQAAAKNIAHHVHAEADVSAGGKRAARASVPHEEKGKRVL